MYSSSWDKAWRHFDGSTIVDSSQAFHWVEHGTAAGRWNQQVLWRWILSSKVTLGYVGDYTDYTVFWIPLLFYIDFPIAWVVQQSGVITWVKKLILLLENVADGCNVWIVLVCFIAHHWNWSAMYVFAMISSTWAVLNKFSDSSCLCTFL